jgi:DNA-binding CsgD family transcriptional regulator
MTQPSALKKNLVPAAEPAWITANLERVLAARSRPARMKRVFGSSLVPMVIVDAERRYVEVNTAARLAFRLPLAELRMLRVEDLTPEHLLPTMREAWATLMDNGRVMGSYSLASPDGGRLDIIYYALADALPGLHLAAFAPAGWEAEELLSEAERPSRASESALTRRELEVLELAAEGFSAPKLASELGVSVATVRTHFAHIYEKLDVGDRASAVAKAIRIGLIA